MSNSKTYDGKLSTATLSAMRLSAALITGADIQYPQNSTLNEFYKLMTARIPDPKARPTLKYMALGYKGHRVENDGEIDDVVPVGKRQTTSGMFSEVPWVLRPLDNDLSDEQRKNYRFRTQVKINGRDYWAYYLRVLDMRTIATSDVETIRENGVPRMGDFVYTDAELHPVPATLPDYDYDDDDTVEMPDGRYVESGVDLQIVWNDFDVQEYLNVISIMRGNPNRAVISEIALCSGLDVPETGKSATGSPFSYTEAIGVQALYHISMYANLAQTNENLALTVRIGQPAPFFLGDAS